MPILRSAEKLEQIFLPSTTDVEDINERAWVTMDISPRKIADMENSNLTAGEGAVVIGMIASRIREWNFTDSDGKPLAITYDTVKLLDFDDFNFLMEKIQKVEPSLTDDEKKTLNPTSQPSETVKVQVQ